MTSNENEIINIGPKETARLRGAGLLGLAFAGAVAAFAVSNHSGWGVSVGLFFLLWFSASALLQARQRTSILLAARRIRKIDGKEEPETYVLTLRERARMIQRNSLLLAVIIMAVVAVVRTAALG